MTVSEAIELLEGEGYIITKIEEEPISLFDEFWAIYPRKDNVAPARKAWLKAIRSSPAALIADALAAQVKAGMFSTERKFIPMASTWLNQARWENPITQTWVGPEGRRSGKNALDAFMESD